MARKKRKNPTQHIDRLREKAGMQGTGRFDWRNSTGKSFRAKGVEGQRHPPERPVGDGDITK